MSDLKKRLKEVEVENRRLHHVLEAQDAKLGAREQTLEVDETVDERNVILGQKIHQNHWKIKKFVQKSQNSLKFCKRFVS